MEHKHIWDKTLNANEEVKYEFSVGKRYRMLLLIAVVLLGLLCFSFSATVAVLVIAAGAFWYGFYVKAANAYAFTDRRVLVHRGWLSTKMITTEYQKITDVTVHEPFVSKLLFSTGSIEIDTAGTNREDLVLQHVENPYEIKKKLDELRGNR
jgi:uncharacterized membrane protein YdbT with pleckstrin-like domain